MKNWGVKLWNWWYHDIETWLDYDIINLYTYRVKIVKNICNLVVIYTDKYCGAFLFSVVLEFYLLDKKSPFFGKYSYAWYFPTSEHIHEVSERRQSLTLKRGPIFIRKFYKNRCNTYLFLQDFRNIPHVPQVSIQACSHFLY